MGVTINKGQGVDAPDIDNGAYAARFDGMVVEEHPDWAQTAEANKFHKADSGRRIRFNFTLLDEDGDELYEDGDPVEVSALTREAFGEKSRAYALFGPILTASERTAFEAGEDLDSDAIEGRRVLVAIEKNKNGWPVVMSVMPAPVAKKKPKPVAVAEDTAEAE